MTRLLSGAGLFLGLIAPPLAREDPRALELIRHDAAHILAEAMQELSPGTRVTI